MTREDTFAKVSAIADLTKPMTTDEKTEVFRLWRDLDENKDYREAQTEEVKKMTPAFNPGALGAALRGAK